MRLPRIKRDWALALAPRELALMREGYVFAGLCILTLVLVALGDVRAYQYGTIGGIAFLPVVAAAWLLSDRLTLLVVGVAMTLAFLTSTLGPVAPVTALTRMILIPILAILARLAATTVIRIRDSEVQTREARASEERMRELERAKSEFLSLASHELRGPISILRGYLAMLEDGTLGPLPAPVEQVVPTLVASAAGISSTIDQMLDTARLEDSRLQIRPRRVDLARLVREAAANVDLLHGKSHGVRWVGCDVATMADVDVNRINTVIGNLVSNAIKYSPAGSEVHVQLEHDKERVRVHVRDQGGGIRTEDMSRLFTRFGRIVTPENSEIPGTGLGLYLSRELARLHGGDVTASSVVGQGSTFTLELPAPKRLARAGTTPPPRKAGRTGVGPRGASRRQLTD
jgi:signal transduction histidine kinase